MTGEVWVELQLKSEADLVDIPWWSLDLKSVKINLGYRDSLGCA